MMRTLAHALIQERFLDGGETTRIVVLPVPGSGLPERLVNEMKPVPLDLLAGRPVNLELDELGLSADLCFSGPPQRCRFPWEAVVAAQNGRGELVQTVVMTMATVMEDETLRPVFDTSQPLRPEPAADRDVPLSDARPGGHETKAGSRPRFQLIRGEGGGTKD